MDKEEAVEPESDAATESDSSVARTQPAIFVDAFLVEGSEEIFRITFGEGTAGQRDRIRFALVMPTEDARELLKTLTSILKKVDTDIAAASKAKSDGV